MKNKKVHSGLRRLGGSENKGQGSAVQNETTGDLKYQDENRKQNPFFLFN
jgi:hypothetical protein